MQAENTPSAPLTRIIQASISRLVMSANLNRELSQRVITLRQKRSLTQADMAERLGIRIARYGHYERGFRRFPVALIPKLAAALECTEAELFGTAPQKVKRGPPSEWEKRIEAIKELPRDKQREIQNVVDALIAKAG